MGKLVLVEVDAKASLLPVLTADTSSLCDENVGIGVPIWPFDARSNG